MGDGSSIRGIGFVLYFNNQSTPPLPRQLTQPQYNYSLLEPRPSFSSSVEEQKKIRQALPYSLDL